MGTKNVFQDEFWEQMEFSPINVKEGFPIFGKSNPKNEK